MSVANTVPAKFKLCLRNTAATTFSQPRFKITITLDGAVPVNMEAEMEGSSNIKMGLRISFQKNKNLHFKLLPIVIFFGL